MIQSIIYLIDIKCAFCWFYCMLVLGLDRDVIGLKLIFVSFEAVPLTCNDYKSDGYSCVPKSECLITDCVAVDDFDTRSGGQCLDLFVSLWTNSSEPEFWSNYCHQWLGKIKFDRFSQLSYSQATLGCRSLPKLIWLSM